MGDVSETDLLEVEIKQRDYLTTDEVASALGVHGQTVRRWEAMGLVRPIRDRSGRRWFKESDLMHILYRCWKRKSPYLYERE